MKHIISIALIMLACGPVEGLAAAWPDNWLGPADDHYMSMKIGVYYYGAVLHDWDEDEGAPMEPSTSESVLEQLAALPELQQPAMETERKRVAAELASAADFMWRNSRFNYAVEYEWMADYTPTLRSSIANFDSPYFSPVDHEAYGDARQKYDGLLQVMVLYMVDKETGELKRLKGGGGFTWGCDGETGDCGWSWWAACTEDNVCGSDWLMVHEFGHQMDSQFDQSGHPEFWFNHLAQLEGNIATFGEHFDANSYIMRRVPEQSWLDLDWGERKSFSDRDEDNVPDYDDYLGSLGLTTDVNGSSIDSDSDRLNDFDEYMASNGNRWGHGERLHPALNLCSPLDLDSDDDGIMDGMDPLPQVPMQCYITEYDPLSPTTAIIVEEKDGIPGFVVRLGYRAHKESEEAEKTLGQLRVSISCPEMTPDSEYEVKLMLDLDNNGWFDGNDNYQVNFNAEKVRRLTKNMASSATEWPQVVDYDLPSGGSIMDAPSGSGVTLIFPAGDFPELAAKPGEIIGFNIGIRNPGEPWYYMVGDPNTLIPLELR